MNAFEFLPHRFPFVLVDKVVKLEKGKHVEAVKQITADDFLCDKTGRMNEVFIIEALAQASGIISTEKGLGLFAAIEDFVFSKPVFAGDTLCLKSDLEVTMKNIHRFQCTAEVDGEKAAEGKVILYVL